MKGRPPVWRRLGRLEAARWAAELRRVTREVALAEGIDPDELWAETTAWLERCRQTGAVTLDEKIDLLAEETGVPGDEIRAELAAMEERRRAGCARSTAA